VDSGGAIPDTDTDTDSHGVSDPPDTRGAISSARAGVAHAMVSCSDRGTGSGAVGGKERRPSCRRRGEVVRRSMVYGDPWLAADDHGDVSHQSWTARRGGTTSEIEVVPVVVPLREQ
jgi:hypothetical protein